jgi:hypothetical protein
MSAIDWSKAPKGATHAGPETEDHYAGFYKVTNSRVTHYCSLGARGWIEGSDGCPLVADLIERPSQPWSGEGLPPVGTVCEHKRVHEWQKVEVFAVKPNYNGSQTALFTYENGCWAGCAEPSLFRPIRTAEQIAAEERAAAIEEMWAIYWKPEPQTAKEALGLLWDAGYRKQEAAK